MTTQLRSLARFGLVGSIVLLGLTLGACSDSNPRDTASKGSPAPSSEAGSGGRPATRTRAGTGGTRAAIPRPPAQAVPGLSCNDQPCKAPDDRVYPCCLSDDSCGAGVNGECRALHQPGTAYKACPSHRAWDDMLLLPGCCKPDGQCGVDIELGFGCVARSEVPAYLQGPLPALPCDAANSPADADAGS